MAKPLCILRYLPKNPAVEQKTFYDFREAAAFATLKRAEGFNVRETTYRYGSRKAPSRGYNVFVYETQTKDTPK